MTQPFPVRSLLTVVLSAILASPGAASGSPPTFKIGLDTVGLNVTVTSDRRDYVGNLTKDDFVVYDNGERQEVSVFGGADVPLDLAVMLDLSGSVRGRLKVIRSAATRVFESLRPGDRGAVIGFNDGMKVVADWTEDRAVLRRAIDSTVTQGGTALYESLYVALRWLNATALRWTSVRRQAVIVVSDGDDTSSVISYEDVLDAVRRGGTLIYTIRLHRPMTPLLERNLRDRQHGRGEYVLTNLARETGANPFDVERAEQLGNIFKQIGTELRSQYLLGYVPRRGDGSQSSAFRTVAVAIPGHARAQARTRTGYLPASAGRLQAGAPLPDATWQRAPLPR